MLDEGAAVLAAGRRAVVVGMQGLRLRPLRTALAGLSLLLGVLAVICVQAASQVADTLSPLGPSSSTAVPPHSPWSSRPTANR